MPTEFDIQYALENTQVLHEPDRRIDTFGSTQFEFQIVTELMLVIASRHARSPREAAQRSVQVAQAYGRLTGARALLQPQA